MSRASKFFTDGEKPEKTTAPKKKIVQKGQEGYWSRNQAERDMEIKRTEDGHVDQHASYYSVAIRLPRAWEDDIKRLAWARKITVTELIRNLVEAELDSKRTYLDAISDFEDEFRDKPPARKNSKK